MFSWYENSVSNVSARVAVNAGFTFASTCRFAFPWGVATLMQPMPWVVLLVNEKKFASRFVRLTADPNTDGVAEITNSLSSQ